MIKGGPVPVDKNMNGVFGRSRWAKCGNGGSVNVLNIEADGELKLLRRTDKLVKSSKIVPLGAPLLANKTRAI